MWLSLRSDFPQACWLVAFVHCSLTNTLVRSSTSCYHSARSAGEISEVVLCHAIWKSHRLTSRKAVFPSKNANTSVVSFYCALRDVFKSLFTRHVDTKEQGHYWLIFLDRFLTVQRVCVHISIRFISREFQYTKRNKNDRPSDPHYSILSFLLPLPFPKRNTIFLTPTPFTYRGYFSLDKRFGNRIQIKNLSL